jgi:Rrf2 family protein
MRLITKDTDYAMRALVYMASLPGTVVPVTEISSELKISHPYLRRLLQILGNAGILNSTKGKNGGFELARKPGDISLLDLVKLFQGKIDLAHCTVNEDPCPNLRTCLIHKKLAGMETEFKREIGGISIKTLADTGA